MMFKTIGRLAVRYMAHVPQRSGDSFQYPDPAGSRNVQASCVRQPETFHQRGDQVTAQTISEWLKKQMGAGGIPAHNMKAHSINYRLWMTGK